eukprot:5128341-Amphidinium_carterae.1
MGVADGSLQTGIGPSSVISTTSARNVQLPYRQMTQDMGKTTQMSQATSFTNAIQQQPNNQPVRLEASVSQAAYSNLEVKRRSFN